MSLTTLFLLSIFADAIKLEENPSEETLKHVSN